MVDRTDTSTEIFTAFNKYAIGYENMNNPDTLKGTEEYYNIK